jgi:hypothetical protein
MSHDFPHLPPPLNLTRWHRLPAGLMVVGGLLALIGAVKAPAEFGSSWLLAFLFFYSIALGALFLVLVHHLTDAGWSVGIRRSCEHLASLLRLPLILMFLPIALFAPKIYPWMTIDPATNNLIAAKLPVFTRTGFYVGSAIFFGVWWLLTSRLDSLSLKQDRTGAAECTRKMRFHSGWGIIAFALTLTASSGLWLEALQYQWFSAMFGVYFFSDCAWAGLATVYVLAAILLRQRILTAVLPAKCFYFMGLLLFAFTLFSAYTEFTQYFVVWNANLPAETGGYLLRENGNWWWLGLFLIAGHFLIPFFLLLPMTVKTNFKIVIPLCLWIGLMHAADLGFNIFPALHNGGNPLKWLWLPLGCLMFMGGFLATVFLKKLNSHPPFPQHDPRLLEAMGVNPDIVNDLAGTATGGGR